VNISEFFIRRPVFASVLSIVIVLVGAVAMKSLPITQYPEVVPPTVEVKAYYTGASAETIADTVAAPLEQEINGVENMLYMNSVSASDGSMTLTVTFETGTDIDDAQVLTQNRVSTALAKLPEDVRRIGVTTKKKSPNILQVVSVYSPDSRYDSLYVSNYVTLRIKDVLARVPGVGDTYLFGGIDYSMRVWLDPEKLAARGLSATDVVNALKEQNKQVAAGQVGQPPTPEGQRFQLTVNTKGMLENPAEFAEVIIHRGENGELVRIRDVGTVELGGKSYSQSSRINGKPATNVAIYQLPGANGIKVAEKVKETMEELAHDFPDGLEYSIPFDTTLYVEKSIETVEHTLVEAILLVVIVVLVFLQTWRTTIIPLLAIPVSLIGTFAVMAALGFTINNLTLFGLVLAIGIVVDDAIVVVENVERKIHHGMKPFDATLSAMGEISGALIAIALVLCAVFVPVAFIPGISGAFYQQFAITIAASTAISATVSLTLSPALAALLLQAKGAKKDLFSKFLDATLGWFFRAFNSVFTAVENAYGKTVSLLLKVAALLLLVYAGLLTLTGYGFSIAPTGFVPEQDQGYLMVNIQLPDGASLERTESVSERVAAISRETEGVSDTIEICGFSLVANAGLSNCSTIFVPLKKFDDRTSPELHATKIAAAIRRKCISIQEAAVAVFGPPPILGLGNGGGFKMLVQDRGGLGYAGLQEATAALVSSANASGVIAGSFSTFRANTPQVELDIDRTRAKRMGLDLTEVFTALQTYMGAIYVNDFTQFGRNWQVNAQADAKFRAKADQIAALKVRGPDGNMVPVGAIATVKDGVGPTAVNRFNLFPAADINGAAAPGKSSGQALAVMESLSRAQLPASAGTEWTEMAFQEKKAGNPITIFILSVLFVFLLLAAQYESWTLPISIILIVPMCMLSAIGGVLLRGMDNNIFTQIGLVVLIGLAAKNAILIVEFARQLEETGKKPFEAAVEAARLRLRPILMTSFAFIAGVLPLVIRSGAGAEMRQALGTAVFFGMLGVTLFGIFFTPVFYLIVRTVATKLSGKKADPA
jgi:multidrug efflux pump